MIVVILTKDPFLMDNLSQLSEKEGLKLLRTGRIERVITELKKPHRVAILDVSMPELRERGVMRQIVNLGRLLNNPIVCICPNQDEELRRLLDAVRPTKTFLRCNLFFECRDFLKGLSLSINSSLTRTSAIIAKTAKSENSLGATKALKRSSE